MDLFCVKYFCHLIEVIKYFEKGIMVMYAE